MTLFSVAPCLQLPFLWRQSWIKNKWKEKRDDLYWRCILTVLACSSNTCDVSYGGKRKKRILVTLHSNCPCLNTCEDSHEWKKERKKEKEKKKKSVMMLYWNWPCLHQQHLWLQSWMEEERKETKDLHWRCIRTVLACSNNTCDVSHGGKKK